MYEIKKSVLKAFESQNREITARCTFNDTFVVNGEHIKKIEISDVASGDTTLTLGNTCSTQLKIDMYIPEDFVGLGNAKINVEIGIKIGETIEYVNMGVFYVDSFKTNSDFKSVSITAYDSMQKIAKLSDVYNCKIVKSIDYYTPLEIIQDIAMQAGINTTVSDNKFLSVSQDGVGICYTPDSISESKTDIGITEPMRIPNATKSIELKCFTDAVANTLTVVFYNDKEMTSLYSYKTYSGSSFGDTIDFDGDEPITYLGCSITKPNTDKDLYMAFSFDTNAFDVVPECDFVVEVQYNPYVNTTLLLSKEDVANANVSPRIMLGYMAALLGGNAKIDRNDLLTVKILENTDYKITGDMLYMNGLTKNVTAELQPAYLTSGIQSDDETVNQVITVGAGNFGFNFSNPYVYLYSARSVAENILALYDNKISFITGEVNYRCNPVLESGDIVQVEDRTGNYSNFLIKSQSITISGGLKSNLGCDIDTNATAEFISAPTNKTVSQHFGEFDKMYQSIISKLTGNQGGYVKYVYDEYNKFRAIAIPERDIDVKWDNSTGKVITINGDREPIWVWSNSGFSYTPDGGNTYNVAINMEGEIYAEMLVGKLSKFVELEAEKGTIGGWKIEENALYSDFDYPTDSNGYNCYRVYLQNANATVNSKDAWAISVQQGTKNSNGLFSGIGKFIVKYDGGVSIGNVLKLNASITDNDGDEIISPYRDGSFVFGYGSYEKNYRTYLEGGDILLRNQSNGSVQIQCGTTTIFDIGRWSTTMLGSTAKRDCILSKSGFVISANNGENALYLQGITVNSVSPFCARSSSTFIGQATFSSSIKASNGIIVDGSNYLNLYKSGNEVWVDGGNNNLILDGSSYIECNSPFRLNFYATSGTVPLVVNTNGQITAATSSKRYKENITDELEENLKPEKLYDLPVVQYNYKDEFKDIELVAGTQIGITAEDVDKHYPDACIYNKDGQPESWQDRIMIPAMLKLIQEQKKQIDTLDERLARLEALIGETGI